MKDQITRATPGRPGKNNASRTAEHSALQEVRSLTMVPDYGTNAVAGIMDEIAISKFKATCLAVLEHVRKTRRPIRVTKFGEPVAEVVPASPKAKKEPWLGSMAGTGRIVGDIVSPASEDKDWEVLNA